MNADTVVIGAGLAGLTCALRLAEAGRKVLTLMQKLDDHDDVQNVSSNFNIPQEAMAEIEG